MLCGTCGSIINANSMSNVVNMLKFPVRRTRIELCFLASYSAFCLLSLLSILCVRVARFLHIAKIFAPRNFESHLGSFSEKEKRFDYPKIETHYCAWVLFSVEDYSCIATFRYQSIELLNLCVSCVPYENVSNI